MKQANLPVTRQIRRSLTRLVTKTVRRENVGHVSATGKSKLQMNPMRKKVIHGLTVAMETYFNDAVRLEDRMESLETAKELNQEWMDRSRGKGRTVPFLKSVANFKDNTNPVGHFS